VARQLLEMQGLIFRNPICPVLMQSAQPRQRIR
jgi:hypothetical protein